MKSLFTSSLATAATTLIAGVMLCGTAAAQNNVPSSKPPAKAATSMDANEAAGLPNLDTINRPSERGTASATVEVNVPRTPSFHEISPGGTEITEYRDHGKPTEINVHSGLGTSYQMTAPTDVAPRANNGGPADTRLPSIKLSY